MSRIVLVLLLVVLARTAPCQTTRDTVKIVSMTPSAPPTRGVPVSIRVEVEVTLHSLDSAEARLGFNTRDPGGRLMVDPRTVYAGRHRYVTVVKTVPVDWGDDGPFALRASVGTGAPNRATWHPLASTVKPVPIKR